MNSRELALEAIKALDSKKATEIRAKKVEDITTLCDYIIFAEGSSNTHTKALADEVDYKLGKLGYNPKGVEGHDSADWILLDFGDVIVNVLKPQARQFYSLEKLWDDGEDMDLSEIIA